MILNTLTGILLPFIGTCLGAGCVFFLKGELNKKLNDILLGFAGGVMIAASVWSLIIPGVEFSADLKHMAFLPVTIGIWAGILFLIILNNNKFFVNKTYNANIGMFFWAVLLHNIPEGMAVGVAYAYALGGNSEASFMAAFLLSVGISIQNFPEGAIISMPIASGGKNKKESFLYGVVSGIVEPLSAVLAIFAVNLISALLPYVLGFAAGAMIFVVLLEIFPEILEDTKSFSGKISFAAGFTVMMILDIVLG